MMTKIIGRYPIIVLLIRYTCLTFVDLQNFEDIQQWIVQVRIVQQSQVKICEE